YLTNSSPAASMSLTTRAVVTGISTAPHTVGTDGSTGTPTGTAICAPVRLFECRRSGSLQRQPVGPEAHLGAKGRVHVGAKATDGTVGEQEVNHVRVIAVERVIHVVARPGRVTAARPHDVIDPDERPDPRHEVCTRHPAPDSGGQRVAGR